MCTADAVLEAFFSVLDSEIPDEAIPFAVAAQASFMAGAREADFPHVMD